MKTSSLQPQEMRKFGARYDVEMQDDWDKMFQRYNEGTGSTEDTMHIEGNWRMNLTYQILKNDIVEKCGFIEPASFQGTKESALQELCRKIINCTNADSNVVIDTVSDFAGRGYLRADISEKGCVWSWS